MPAANKFFVASFIGYLCGDAMQKLRNNENTKICIGVMGRGV
jgi:hypothetical protein